MRQALVITELTQIVGRRGFRVVRRPTKMADYFPIPLSWRSFAVGRSDYDAQVDEAYCPCGATVYLGDDYYVLGDFVDAAVEHIAEKHPGVRCA